MNALAGLLSACLLAIAITDLAQSDVRRGLLLLGVVVVARWLIITALGEWGYQVSATVKARWRRELPFHFTRPRLEHERARGDLALAIDRAAEAPFLEVLATSARVAVLGLGIVYWAAGWLSLTITLLLLAAAVPLYLRAGRRSEAMAARYEQRRAVLESRQLELLRHAPELRSLGAIQFGAGEIAAISDSEHAIALRAIRIALESSLVTEFLSGVSIGLVAMVVGFALLGGRMTLSHALVAVLVTSEVFLQVRRFGTEFHRREDAARSIEILADVSSRLSDVGNGDLLTSDQLVTLVNERPVSVRLEVGDRLLVTGPSGSGKTTLLQTWLGWSPTKSGSVECTDLPVGYVSVGSSLLSGSLRDNLTLGASITDARVHELLDSLGLTEPRFSDLDVQLLADGHGMSTGEKVRLVLARALLAGPVLLMLDDIAGVLDGAARERVLATLARFPRLTIIEATVDDPTMTEFNSRLDIQE
jgi:ATP-binding cassette subfamily C protein CydD